MPAQEEAPGLEHDVVGTGAEAPGKTAPGAPPTRRSWPDQLLEWRRAGGGWLLLFTVTLFLSSALLFAIQPMFAKMVLPLLGGTPATWITSMLFFQSALLAGYAYAHWSTRWLGERRQTIVHGLLVVVAVAALPVAVPRGWAPRPEDHPVAWLLAVLLVGVGLPFFVVSSTTPLLQRWFARSPHAAAHDPYFLYRASNLGSMVGLLAYPALVEPRLRLADQGRMWAAGYLGLAALTAGCALAPWRAGPRTAAEEAGEEERAEEQTADRGAGEDSPVPLGVARRAHWLALAFVPSSFMLAVTTYITTDIAAVPLLWVVPLALYLLSFIAVFSRGPFLLAGLTAQLHPFLVLQLVLLVVLGATEPVLLVVAVSLVAMFVSALVCHGRLAEDRPPSRQLTEFYLWVALGGALGGAFNAVVAPTVFDSVVELPLAIVLACLLRDRQQATEDTGPARVLDLVLPVGLLAFAVGAVAVGRAAGLGSTTARVVAFVVALLLCAGFAARPARLALGVAAVFVAAAVASGGGEDTLYANRTFFGVLRVERDGERETHRLVHGNTTHGAQSTDPGRRREPLTYYHRTGPVGQVFAMLRAPAEAEEVGVVGLGTGTLACHGRPGQRWTFYEIDPAVARIARDPHLFTYLRDCPPQVDVVLGDARLSLARSHSERFGVIVVDAFNSDAIPVHLLTREALALYLDKLAEGGVLVVHITNRYLDLAGVVGDLVADARLAGLVRDDLASEPRMATGRAGSVWAVLARRPSDLAPLAAHPDWRPLPTRAGAEVWTDDFSNLLGALRRG